MRLAEFKLNDKPYYVNPLDISTLEPAFGADAETKTLLMTRQAGDVMPLTLDMPLAAAMNEWNAAMGHVDNGDAEQAVAFVQMSVALGRCVTRLESMVALGNRYEMHLLSVRGCLLTIAYTLLAMLALFVIAIGKAW